MRRALLALVAAALAGGGLAWHWLADGPEAIGFQGYIEGNLVYMAAEDGGRIERLAVDAGDVVQAGQLLFALDEQVQQSQKNEAEARLRQAQAQLANLKAAVQRPEQIAILKAQEARARAQLELSRAEYERQRTLFQKGIATKAQLDQAEAAHNRDQAALQEVLRSIDAGQLAGRGGEIMAAEAWVRAGEASLRQAVTRLLKRQVHAPTDSRVQDIYFRAGEVVNAGQPVLALLPPANLKLRFYVPEPALASIALGQPVAVTCDNCGAGFRAKVTFISREAEYTPPVIFSERERAKLVFRVEAKPLERTTLPVGLPVTVTPEPPGTDPS